MPNQIMRRRRTNQRMINVIKRLGLEANLKLCLDAADIDSYGGTSQAWTDLSGSGYHFNRGTGGGSDGADPSFNGVAGRQSSADYFSFDGADTFTLGQATPAWISALHKNNATGTMAAWVWFDSLSGIQMIISTYSVTAPAIQFACGPTGTFVFFANDGVSGTVISQETTAAVPTNAWAFVAFSIDEATAALTLQINGTQESKSGTYTGPSASNANVPATIGRDTDATLPMLSGNRIAAFLGWDTDLTAAELMAVFNATRAKFGV